MKSIILIRAALLLLATAGCGQALKDTTQIAVPPGTTKNIGRSDTTQIAVSSDTARVVPFGTIKNIGPSDTTKSVDTTSRSSADTIVVYSASDSITFSPITRFMNMYGKGTIDYRTTKLKAERIDINWNTSTLVAYGVKDSADTTRRKMKGAPQMTDAGEPYTGSEIAYNFKTQRGYIRLAESQMNDAYYSGAEIRKVDKDILYVSNGEFTTCDKSDPDYHFASSEMKVIPHDKIIAKPIYFYIEDVPVFILPFGIFPNERGRRSGIIAPTYGEDAQLGRYLARGGYYWAISDYMDFALRGDWYNKGGWVLHSLFNYALRYNFGGSVDLNWTSKHFGLRSDPGYTTQRDYSITLNHHQEFDPTMRADVNFSFASGSYYQNTTTNLDDFMRQNIVSNATLNKSWEGTSNSASLNIYRDQDLSSGNILMRLPSITFTHSQSYPFRRSKLGQSSDNFKWYEYIGVSYTGLFESDYNKTKRADSSGSFDRTERHGAEHSISISASPKAGFFTIAPQFSYSEQWYPENTDQFFNPADSLITTRKNKGFKAVRTFSTGVSVSTKVYGIFPVRLLGLQGFRHTLTPSLSYNYSPDFSKESWGYYGRYHDPRLNTDVTYNRYAEALYGGAPSGEQQSINLSIGNIFEAKAAQPDTSKEAAKYQLLNLTGNVSYNFAADSLRLSDLSLNYRTDIASIVNVGGTAAYTFYRVDTTAGFARKVNRFLISEHEGLARLTRFSFNISTTLASGKVTGGQSISGGRTIIPGGQTIPGGIPLAADTTAKSQTRHAPEEESGFYIPWNLTLTWDYSVDRSNPFRLIRSSNLQGTMSMNFTRNWRLNLSGSFDIVSRKVAAVTLELYRDLHCWEMNFKWYPTGYFRGFNLEIRVKAPELRDLKLTKQGGVYTRG